MVGESDQAPADRMTLRTSQMLRWQSVISGGPNFSAAADAAIDTGDGGTFSRLMISVEIWIRLSVFDVIEELLFPVQRHEVHPLIRFDSIWRGGRSVPQRSSGRRRPRSAFPLNESGDGRLALPDLFRE